MAHPSATASWSTSRSSQVADATFREFGACSNLGMGQKMSKPIITKLMLNDYQVIAIFGEINIHQHPFASYLWVPRAAKFRPRLAAVLPPTVGRAAASKAAAAARCSLWHKSHRLSSCFGWFWMMFRCFWDVFWHVLIMFWGFFFFWYGEMK